MGMIRGLFVGIIVVFIALMFIVEIVPQMEENISSANITNPMTSTLIDMSVWVVPVLAIVGIIIATFAFFKLRGRGGD